MEDILKTCLHQKHLDLGAKMMPFGGFEMPKSVKSFTA